MRRVIALRRTDKTATRERRVRHQCSSARPISCAPMAKPPMAAITSAQRGLSVTATQAIVHVQAAMIKLAMVEM